MSGPDMFGFEPLRHQSQLPPAANKFHVGNGDDGKHYWLTPPALYAALDAEFKFDFDPCPFPLPEGFDGLTCEWGRSNYVNPPFGSIIHQGKKKGPTAWVRKAIIEQEKGKRVVLVYPVDKWVLMLLKAILGEHAQVRNLGDVRWLAMVIVQRLMSADRPLTAKELLAGTNVDRGSWKMTSHRVRASLAAQGYAMVNVRGFGPWQARYRLQPVEER